MQVSITHLRADLARWIGHARGGEDVIVTDRGLPVARLTALESTSLIERLERDGVISPPRSSVRPRASAATRVRATGPVSDLISEQRR